MEDRVQNSINFLRSAYVQACQKEDKTFTMDAETIKILLDLLKEMESEIAFLKGMQLQTARSMNEEELGSTVGRMLGLLR